MPANQPDAASKAAVPTLTAFAAGNLISMDLLSSLTVHFAAGPGLESFSRQLVYNDGDQARLQILPRAVHLSKVKMHG
jgi:hypothetical protein